MSKIKRGGSKLKRTNAKNFIQEQAQKRLDETVPAFNKQVENSLFVNAVEVDYYSIRSKIGKPCTCEKIEVQDRHQNLVDGSSNETNMPPIVPTIDEDSSAGLSITLQDDDLFGDSPAEKLYGETIVDVSGMEQGSGDDDIPLALLNYVAEDGKEGNTEYTETSMLGSNANCGICYRTGYQPGYDLYGAQRYILTSLDVTGIGGYHISPTDTPNSFIRQGPIKNHTYVEFTINVPKYFKGCKYSIRNNTEILRAEKIMFEGTHLTLQTLKQYAGTSITFIIKTEKFTHVVMEFDLGLEKIRANLGPETASLSYTQLEAIGDFPVVLPPSLAEVNNGDILILRDRLLVLKVMQKERKITADKRQLEWVIQTRVVQPTEPIKRINKHIKMV
jgi:hypothetical protein